MEYAVFNAKVNVLNGKYGNLSWFDPTEYDLTSDCEDYSDAQEAIMDHVMNVVCEKFGVKFK